MSTVSERVCAIVITYNPVPHELMSLLNALIRQVEQVVIVDNASTNDIRKLVASAFGNVIAVVAMSGNHGLAAAQNVGLRMAAKHGIPYAILFDQDSIPDACMVKKLLDCLVSLRLGGENVAAVGPNYLGPGASPFRRFAGLTVKRCTCNSSDELVAVDFLISSGCLIALDAYQTIGEMKEQFFIDQVDVEWGIRARQCGYRLVGVCGANMQHRIGDKFRTIFGNAIPMHSPLRHYYMVRNSVWLYTQSTIPLSWRIAGALNLARKLFLFLWIVSPWLAHMRMIILGIVHGALGKLGPLAR
jgi:rhamnosyltransferase